MPPVLDPEKCVGCGRCVDVCPEDVYFGSQADERPKVSHPEFCFHCNLCVEECPYGALKLRIPLPLMISFKKGGN